MALPPDESVAEHNATVCLPCPKCGNIIKSYKVSPTVGNSDTTVVNALCDQCQWSDEAAVPTEDLGHTSLALPQLQTLAPPSDLPPGRTLDDLIDASQDRHPVLDNPIFLDKPASPPPKKPTVRPDLHEVIRATGASAFDEEDEMPSMSCAPEDDDDTGTFMLEDIAGTPPMSASAPKRPTATYQPVVRRTSTATRRRQRAKRSKREAWVLSIACFIALAMGGLELSFLAHRMTTPQIILVAVFLVPVTVFLVDGLKGLWRDTRPA